MKNLIIGIAVVVVVAGGGYWYFTSIGHTSSDNDSAMTGESNESMADDQSGDFSGSLQDLAKRGGNYKCTFVHDSSVAESSGTVYISGDNLRGDFESKTQGITAESHMIAKDGYTYTWSPLTPTGFKAKIVDTGSTNDSAAAQGSYTDANQSYTYQCEAWSSDASYFDLPAITFIDINNAAGM